MTTSSRSSAEKNDLGFTRFGWSQYRKYFDDSGGYYPAFPTPILDLNRDLYLDTGRAWADFGLTLPQWPTMVLGYEYQYRDGTEATTQWGPVSNGTQTRNIYPAVQRHLGARPYPEVRLGLRDGHGAPHATISGANGIAWAQAGRTTASTIWARRRWRRRPPTRSRPISRARTRCIWRSS